MSYRLEPDAQVPDSITVTKLPVAQTRFMFALKTLPIQNERNDSDMDVSDDDLLGGLIVNGASNFSIEMVFAGELDGFGAQTDDIFDKIQTDVEMQFNSAKLRSTSESLDTARFRCIALTRVPFREPESFHAQFSMTRCQGNLKKACMHGALLRDAYSKLLRL